MCTLPADVRLAVADFHADCAAVAHGFALAIRPGSTQADIGLYSLAQLGLNDSVRNLRACGYLPFLH